MRSDNLVGRTIAGYRLAEYVGEGGTATVYKAEHPVHGTAALKVLRPRLVTDEVAVKRFEREAEFGTRVNHPNVIHTLDFGEVDGLKYLALQWAAGEPLGNFAVRSGRLAPPLVATIVEQLAAALAALHDEGIVHRDLKPANVMYDPATQKTTLLDFGIARDTDSSQERLTRAGFFVGTLQYVAPETLSGELVGPQADVYSLATIAYNLLTGVLPFPGKNPRELFQQLLTQAPTPLNQAVEGLRFPADLEAAVMRGLARDLAKRSPSVRDFAAEFCAAARRTEEPKAGGGFLRRLFGKGE